MCILSWCLLLGSLCFVQTNPIEATYRCGIRKHAYAELVHRGYNVEEGEWPWHAGLFHKTVDDAPKYACGGSLLNQKHILTAAHCVLNHDTSYPLPAANIEVRLGLQRRSEITDHVQVRDVSEVYSHPDYTQHRNDIAVLVLRLPVEYTDFVIPICIDRKADRDLRNLEGQRGWIAGWGTTESGALSDVLRAASMPVVSHVQCYNDDHLPYGLVNENVFCAGDRNGISPGTGDSGGGMYFLDGDRWVLRGIVSFAKVDEQQKEVDTSKYAVFVNVQRFLTWIEGIVDKNESAFANRPKRISEQECERFERLVARSKYGRCANSRFPHTVSLIDQYGIPTCCGFLVNENHIITAASCFERAPVKVQFDATTHDVSNYTRHPKYRDRYIQNDLGVIKLKTSVHLSSSMIPACLASNWTENLYDTLVQTGFGGDFFSNYNITRTFIESDDNQVITTAECNHLNNPYNASEYIPITPNNLCVINRDKLRSRISGSAGSPLQSGNAGTCMNTVVGVLIGRFSNSNIGLGPDVDVYSRIAYNLDWIEQVVWNVEPPMMTTVSTSDEESTISV